MAGLCGFRVKVDASEVTCGLRRKFILNIDFMHHRNISDIVRSVQDVIKSKKDIALFVGDYYLPASESIHALRDGDEITVFHETGFIQDAVNDVVPGENIKEYTEWKKKKKRKNDIHSECERKQKRKKCKNESSKCNADLYSLNEETKIVTCNSNISGNASENDSILVNCISLMVSSDEEAVNKTINDFGTSMKVPEIEANYGLKEAKSNIEKEKAMLSDTYKTNEIIRTTERAQNGLSNDTKHLKKEEVSLGHCDTKVIKATENEVDHAFAYNTSNEHVKKQDNILSPDGYSFRESAECSVAEIENTTKQSANFEGDSYDTSFNFTQDNDAADPFSFQGSGCTESKRKRRRKRTHKKNKVPRQNSQYSAPVKHFCDSGVKAEENQTSASQKHIRFADDIDEENIKEDSISKVPVDVTVTENVVAKVPESKQESATNVSLQENETDKLKCNSPKQNTGSSSAQWDVKPDLVNTNAFEKLLSLGWSSTPLVYQRKKATKTEAPKDDVKENNSNKLANSTQENGTVNGHIAKNGMNFTAEASLTSESILNYPVLQTLPKKKDILAFKILKMGEDYTPQLSDYIVAEVKQFCSDTQQMELRVLQGAEQFAPPKGKFLIETEEEENSKVEWLHLNWNELMGTRIIYP